MKHIYYIIATMILFTVSCSNKKSPESQYPMDYPSYNTSADSAKPDSTISEPIDQKPVNTQSSNYSKDSREKEIDNMRGFDPASEDDMEDNGMSRYMENNDEEGWDYPKEIYPQSRGYLCLADYLKLRVVRLRH